MNWGRSSRSGAASPTDCQCRSRFVLYQMACREEQALHQRENSTVWLAIVDGRAHDECIRHSGFLDKISSVHSRYLFKPVFAIFCYKNSNNSVIIAKFAPNIRIL